MHLQKYIIIFFLLIIVCLLVSILSLPNFSFAQAQGETDSVKETIVVSTPLAISFMISILILKVTAFVLGYLVVKLGHDTLIKGVSGEIDFGFSGSGFKTKLKAASPGALFVLMGSAIIMWSMFVEKPLKIDYKPANETVQTQQNPKPALNRIPVPDAE